MDQRIMYCTALKRALTERIWEMRPKMPGLHANFFIHEYDELSQDLEENNLDIALFLHQSLIERESEGIVSTCLFDDEMVMAARSDDPLEDSPETIRKIAQERGVALLGREDRGLSQVTQLFDELSIAPPITLVPIRDVILLALNSGERAAVLPQSLFNEITEPQIRILHFRSPKAALHGMATWNTHNSNPLIAQLIATTRQLFDMGVRSFGSR